MKVRVSRWGACRGARVSPEQSGSKLWRRAPLDPIVIARFEFGLRPLRAQRLDRLHQVDPLGNRR